MSQSKEEEETMRGHVARDTWLHLGHVDVSGDAAGLEVVGDGDVCAPHVELPLAEPQHAAQHRPGVDPFNTEIRAANDPLVFTNTEKAPTSWMELLALSYLRHYAKQVLTQGK